MKMRMSLAAVAVLLTTGFALAQEVDAGKKLYDESCAGCHGATGLGGGELSALLTIATPKLTDLSSRNSGEFPMLKVIHVIDGRSGMRAHGGPMPVFGNLYSASSGVDDGGYSAILEVRGKVLSLAMYLESIQQ